MFIYIMLFILNKNDYEVLRARYISTCAERIKKERKIHILLYLYRYFYDNNALIVKNELLLSERKAILFPITFSKININAHVRRVSFSFLLYKIMKVSICLRFVTKKQVTQN